MKKKNTYTLQIFILCCTIALPFSTLLCRRDPNKPTATTQASSDSTDEELDEEQRQPDTTIIASTKEIQVATPIPGILTRMYSTVAPIILVTLNQALGTGIGATTKSLIKQFMARQAFTTLKNDTLLKIDQKLAPEYLQTMSQQNKLDLAKALLAQQKIDFDRMEKQTSFSSILGQAVYIGMLNTVIPIIGTFVGYGATLALQTMMPGGKS
ncbi:MAG TPA: hypothetical protein VJJ26_02250 [Candidatus Babeliales bacterium]|nr:hypothetical protein [Candidatus Babeliales bacterium]